jgi:hypothetical protein
MVTRAFAVILALAPAYAIPPAAAQDWPTHSQRWSFRGLPAMALT